MPTRKLLGALAIVAAIAGGGVIGALVAIPVASNAQETTTSTTQADNKNNDKNNDHADHRPHLPFKLFPGRRGMGLVDLEVAAKALGISEDDLRDALRDGDSIADVAEERDVDIDKVIDALVKDATSDIDDAVGRFKENLPERMADVVNNEGGFCGDRFGPHSRRGG